MIFKFSPIWVPKPWGGESWLMSAVQGRETIVSHGDYIGCSLSELVAIHGASLIGERVYARYGEKFPLLLKIIDARRDLSIQVHPDDATARRLEADDACGKTEMWYVADAGSGARLLAGLKPCVTEEQYARVAGSSGILDLLETHEVHKGDSFFLPPGCVHAIGAGCRIVEIQQSSDITYRIYDYGRKRQLHLNKARQAVAFPPVGNCRVLDDKSEQRANLAHCNAFVVDRCSFSVKSEIRGFDGAFAMVTLLEGSCMLGDTTLSSGESALVSPEGAMLTPITKRVDLLLASV